MCERQMVEQSVDNELAGSKSIRCCGNVTRHRPSDESEIRERERCQKDDQSDCENECTPKCKSNKVQDCVLGISWGSRKDHKVI